MEQYSVEGLYLPKRNSKKTGKAKREAPLPVEPFARLFWASSPEDAVRQATEALAGGHWVEGPQVSRTTEEQRMRARGAPELPLFQAGKKQPSRKR